MSDYFAERFFSLHPRHHMRRPARRYVLEWIQRPVAGSVFDRQTRWFRGWLPGPALLWVLQCSGRDGILLFGDTGEVVAHVFWHRHGDCLHMFNVVVRAQDEGRGLMTSLLAQHFIPYAHALPGILRVRISAGGRGAAGQDRTRFRHDRVVSFCEKLTAGRIALPAGIVIVSEGDFYFSFPDKVARDAVADLSI